VVLRLLADPVRWQLACELARGDHRVRELVAATGHPQNLVSYHLRQLRDGGLVTARRSSFDARDTYYSLDLDGCARALAHGAASLHPGLARLPGWPAPPSEPGPAASPARQRHRVLFVCTGNSARSPVAAALLRHRAGPRVLARSAGIRPKPVHPDAVAVLRERYRIDISGHRPTQVQTVAGQRFDYVISLCDKAREACPEFAGQPGRIHWSLPDPATAEGGLAGPPAFERMAADLDTRIRFLLPAIDPVTSADLDPVEQETEYARDRDRSLARLRKGMDLGTGGDAGWSRDSLHER
jgi:ArsR family transcriptional regulator, arsenate/arsenite/antimonite-responsive transcriptional repressor / arsenate reductase (thioredoxin)